MKKRNSINDLSEFTRYIRGEMSKREENAFQRKLQKDPFYEEAAEGLTQISHDEALSDLDVLERRLNKRISGNRRMVIYRIAASVAVLMIVSSVYFILNRDKPAREMAKTAAAEAAGKMDESAETILAAGETAAERDEVITAETRSEEVTARQETTVSMVAAEPVTVFDAEKLAGAQAAAMKKSVLPEARGVIISSEDNLPIPGAMITLKGTTSGAVTDTGGRFRIPLTDTVPVVLVTEFIGMEKHEVEADISKDMKISMIPSQNALSEVVLVSYDAKAKESIDKTAYVPAQPLTGKNAFDSYIEDNIRKPTSLPSGQRVVVVLGFTVRKTGAVENIKVIRSPGQEFSDEALRLIREGPAWKPAEENGQPVDEEVRIRIVFK